MAKPPSAVERAIEALRDASGPMDFTELLDAIQAEGPIGSKNPKNTLRSAIGNTTLIVSTGAGQYEYVPRATTGCVLRQPLRLEEAEEGVIVWECEVSAAIWPASHEHSQKRRDDGPRRFRFTSGQEVALTVEWLEPRRFGSPGAGPLWEWLRGQGAESGDELLVQIVDGETRVVELAFQPRQQRDERAICARNAELADAAEQIVERRTTKSMFLHESVAELIVRGLYRGTCPPDPLTPVLVNDERFAVDDFSVTLPDRVPDWVGQWGWRPAESAETTADDAPSNIIPLPQERVRGKRPGRARAAQDEGAAQVYQLKVTLEGIRPPIWRRIQVGSDISLAGLHEVLQVTMGWDNCHLYQFIMGRTSYGEPHPDYEGWGTEMHDAADTRLDDVLRREKGKITYEYDFGDSWYHGILLEKILPPDPSGQYPICLKGKRAGPPEDCGGTWGYMEFQEAIRDPEHEQHDELLEWAGGEFDPEELDLDLINVRL